MKQQPVIESRGNAVVGWDKCTRHPYEDRFRLLCRPVPIVVSACRGELFSVCDGVGSAPKGMAAAQAVCDVLVRFYDDHKLPALAETIQELLVRANDEIAGWGFIPGTDRSEGACAATVIWIDEANVAHIFHAGDTGAILIRDGVARALTSAQHLDGCLSNYFGLSELRLECGKVKLEEGDRLLLFSDGISKVLHNQRLADIAESQTSRQASVSALIRAARVAGSTDDITVLLIDVEEYEL